LSPKTCTIFTEREGSHLAHLFEVLLDVGVTEAAPDILVKDLPGYLKNDDVPLGLLSI
jgi:hypothetical protein